jgi:acetolactate synthase I/II/III large subunit
VFLDVPMDQFFSRADVEPPGAPARERLEPDQDAITSIAAVLASARQPVLVIGSDVWSDGADEAALRLAETAGVPVITNGMGRGVLPAGHPLLVTRGRSVAFGEADLVVVAGAPLDFRLGYGVFGAKDDRPGAPVVHLADSPGQVARHVDLAGSAAGDLGLVLDGLLAAWQSTARVGQYDGWVTRLQDAVRDSLTKDRSVLESDADPIHPGRVYGELRGRLGEDSVVIGDGGDFVSFAGKYVEPARPGGWLDPGPYGCLGTGLGYAIAARIARPSSQVVLLLGDGAAGFSLMDVDTLVRHRLPVVMVVGNNSGWGLEKHPMRMLYGYDVAAELGSQTRYDEVVRALGGAGELVTEPGDIGPALDRAFASGVPYLVNVITDPEVAYPRATTGI